MVKSMRALSVTVLVAVAALPATAQATCWNDAAADAAAVRDMETMLMVGALRCRGESQAMIARYNGFVREHRAALTQANDQLRAHFSASGTGLNGYDRYVTALANRHGGGDGLNCQQIAYVLDYAASGPGSFAKLAGMAHDLEMDASLPGGRCVRQIARR